MALGTAPPARDELSIVTNSDYVKAWGWLRSDGTPEPIASAVVTLEFEQPPTVWGEDGLPIPPPPAERHVIDSTDPDDPAGYVDADWFDDGVIRVTIPNGIWSGYDQRDGKFDAVAVSVDGKRLCIVRGTFTVQEGVST